MVKISTRALDLVGTTLSATTAAAAGTRFLSTLGPLGAVAIYARALRGGPQGDEQVYSRISPRGWESLYAERRFHDINPMLRELRHRSATFRWSDMSLLTEAERAFTQAVSDFGADDGLAIPCYGANGYVGVVSLAFENLKQIDPTDRAAVEISALVLHERMRSLSRPSASPLSRLSPRERDCLAFIADGKSDDRIADIMGIASSTVATHVKNARAKLGARTRAQAVALHLASRC